MKYMETQTIRGKVTFRFARYATSLQNEYIQYKLKIWECMTVGIVVGGILAQSIGLRIPHVLLYLIGLVTMAGATYYAGQMLCKRCWTTLALEGSVTIHINSDTREVIWNNQRICDGITQINIFRKAPHLYPIDTENGMGYSMTGKPHKQFVQFAKNTVAPAEMEHYYKVSRVHVLVIPEAGGSRTGA